MRAVTLLIALPAALHAFRAPTPLLRPNIAVAATPVSELLAGEVAVGEASMTRAAVVADLAARTEACRAPAAADVLPYATDDERDAWLLLDSAPEARASTSTPSRRASRRAWRARLGEGKPIVEAARDAIEPWVPAGKLMTMRGAGGLVYAIRAGLIDDKGLMADVDADALSVEAGRRDLPGLSGPTVLLNLPRLLGALVKLFTPLFPPAVRKKLKFDSFDIGAPRARDDAGGKAKLLAAYLDDTRKTVRGRGPDVRDGEDPRWTAIHKNDYTNKALQFYHEDYVTTSGGSLNITTTPEHTKFESHQIKDKKHVRVTVKKTYRSGMVQGWNKFCFTGGILEIRAKLPGRYDVGGLWPGMWMMGNLARGDNVFFYGMRLDHGSDEESYWADAVSGNTPIGASEFEDFHTYRLEWKPKGSIDWYKDGKFLYGIDDASISSLTGGQLAATGLALVAAFVALARARALAFKAERRR
ncbi:beta-1,6-glucosyl hydrolase [Aureococcus anophagefferens]|uniref:Beta-1,6-glucosyl hydrolase n=1 Tax=Aureococcus anophagefferens TaxID=44056 RepID=A0ABR1FY13_AURAN